MASAGVIAVAQIVVAVAAAAAEGDIGVDEVDSGFLDSNSIHTTLVFVLVGWRWEDGREK